MPAHTHKLNNCFLIVLIASTVYLGVANAQPYAYVSNLTGNYVAVLNTSSGTLSTIVSVPSGPNGVAVTADGGSVYVASQNANVVSVLSTSSNAVVGTINVGTSPTAVVVRPGSSQVFVVDQGSNQVSVISGTSVVATLNVGLHPDSIAFTADGSRAFVTNSWGGTVSIIDATAPSVIGSFSVAGPVSVAVGLNGRVYVGNGYSGTVTVHDTAGNQLSSIAGFALPNAMAVAPNGRLFVTNGNAGTVSVVDTTSNTLVATLPTGNVPSAVAISTDGGRAYVANEYSFSLAVVDTSSLGLVSTIQKIGLIFPVGVAMTPPAAGTPPPPPPPPPSCTYSLSTTSTSIGSAGGTIAVSVTASPAGSCNWSATSDSSWLTASNGSFSASANTGIPSRTGNFSIAGTGLTQPLNLQVTQAGVGFAAIRLNAGGSALTDPSGNVWSADNQQGNRTQTTAAITGTNMPALYQKESWSTGILQYSFAVPTGSFLVKLHFVEFYLTQVGQRRFNVVINGTTYFSNVDILQARGANTAYDLSVPISVSSGQITVQIVPLPGSTAQISGLEILSN